MCNLALSFSWSGFLVENYLDHSIMVTFLPSHKMGVNVPLCTISVSNPSVSRNSAHSLKSSCKADSTTPHSACVPGYLTNAQQHFQSTSITMNNALHHMGLGVVQVETEIAGMGRHGHWGSGVRKREVGMGLVHVENEKELKVHL